MKKYMLEKHWIRFLSSVFIFPMIYGCSSDSANGQIGPHVDSIIDPVSSPIPDKKCLQSDNSTVIPIDNVIKIRINKADLLDQLYLHKPVNRHIIYKKPKNFGTEEEGGGTEYPLLPPNVGYEDWNTRLDLDLTQPDKSISNATLLMPGHRVVVKIILGDDLEFLHRINDPAGQNDVLDSQFAVRAGSQSVAMMCGRYPISQIPDPANPQVKLSVVKFSIFYYRPPLQTTPVFGSLNIGLIVREPPAPGQDPLKVMYGLPIYIDPKVLNNG